jgi:RNA-binding protein Nova
MQANDMGGEDGVLLGVGMDGGSEAAEFNLLQPDEDGLPSEDECALKLLVNNSDAGSVIGKGGAKIAQLQDSTGARCRLSRSGEFFPGTKKRVILLTGTLEAVTSCQAMILTQLSEDAILNAGGTGADGREREVVPGRTAENFIAEIAVPNAGAGAIIGKGGATINDIRDQTGARLHVSPKDAQVCTGGGGDGGSSTVCGGGGGGGHRLYGC